jgi:hypothetical protein
LAKYSTAGWPNLGKHFVVNCEYVQFGRGIFLWHPVEIKPNNSNTPTYKKVIASEENVHRQQLVKLTSIITGADKKLACQIQENVDLMPPISSNDTRSQEHGLICKPII